MAKREVSVEHRKLFLKYDFLFISAKFYKFKYLFLWLVDKIYIYIYIFPSLHLNFLMNLC